MKRAFTLLEVLVAIGIVLLLAAIIFPVVTRAKEAGYRAESIAHLRQVGTGIELYRGDFDGQLAFGHLDSFVKGGYFKEGRLLRSHPDEFLSGYGTTLSRCMDTFGPTTIETSYETSLATRAFYERVRALDNNAAIVVDRTHGETIDWANMTCDRAAYFYSGRILRLYEDTSIKIGQFSLIDWEASPDIGLAWHRVKLFTDKEQ